MAGGHSENQGRTKAKPKPGALASVVRLLREGRGLSMRDVERASGVSKAMICRIETGRLKNPTVFDLAALSDPLDIDPLTLMRAALADLPEGA